MTRPLFILGKHRSGTTFLGNLLMNHPQVAAVTAEQCGGIVGGIFESAYFSLVEARYKDLSDFENYTEFASVMSKAEYFILAGVSFDELMSYFPADYPEVFQKVMNKFASDNSADYWLEKTPPHTLKAKKIKRYYPDAKFIGMVRDETETALSSLYLKSKSAYTSSKLFRIAFLVYVTMMKYLYDVSIFKLKKKYPDDVLIINYDDLVNKTEKTTEAVCLFLGIQSRLLNSSFGKNTSFKGSKKKQTLRLRDQARKNSLPIYS